MPIIVNIIITCFIYVIYDMPINCILNIIIDIIITCFIMIIVVNMIMIIIVLRPAEQAAGGCFSLLLEDPSPSVGSTGRRSDHNRHHHHHDQHDHDNHQQQHHDITLIITSISFTKYREKIISIIITINHIIISLNIMISIKSKCP